MKITIPARPPGTNGKLHPVQPALGATAATSQPVPPAPLPGLALAAPGRYTAIAAAAFAADAATAAAFAVVPPRDRPKTRARPSRRAADSLPPGVRTRTTRGRRTGRKKTHQPPARLFPRSPP